MKKLSVFIMSLLLFSGCAGFQAQKGPRGNFVEVLRLGLNINKTLAVTTLIEGFPAEVAGVKHGDIIVSLDGKKMEPHISFASIMKNKVPGEYISLVVNRSGEKITLKVKPRVIKMRPTQIVINKLLYLEKKKITMAVIISEIKNSLKNVPDDWIDFKREDLLSSYEIDLLSAYGGSNENFSIVDRTKLRRILDEAQFSETGFVPDELRVKIGEMTGATHLFDISFSRYQGLRKTVFDKLKVRLVDVESGKILAVDRLKLSDESR